MGAFARGKYAIMISDRSGLQFRYREMVREWTGMWVHTSEWEKKQPQLSPRPIVGDPIALEHPRPSRPATSTPTMLNQENPFTTSVGTTVTVRQLNHGLSTGDYIRFRNITIPIGATDPIKPVRVALETTLVSDITSSATSLTLTDSSNFPSTGYIVVDEGITNSDGENLNETIYYGANDTGTGILSSLTRGTAAQCFGGTPNASPAVAHSAGAPIGGSFYATNIGTDSFSFPLTAASTAIQTGGGFEGFVGPVNNRP